MNNNEKMANLLFPNINKTPEFYFKKYPKRNLLAGVEVTRYAPSPTGYMHIGNFFQMFISYSLAKSTNGIFLKRLEDTDEKRAKEGAYEVINEIMDGFGIIPDEYQNLDGEIKGEYGPYIQTQRKEIYATFAKYLVSKGEAFPCFCEKFDSKEDIIKSRETKFINNDITEYDPCRNLSIEEVENNLKNGKNFAIRLKTHGTGKERIKFIDLIKGEIDTLANAKDVILLKSDGIPPYAFAHIIDDYLMGVTLVVRGEEYISSTPVHLEIIKALGFDNFKYCHNPLICKIPENGNKRKISKRFDPEADMRYYFSSGYPIEAVLEYLLNLISSKFEGWKLENPNSSWKEFKFGITDITAVSPIFDLVKLNDISKNLISKMTAKEVYDRLVSWAKIYDKEFYGLLNKNIEFSLNVLNIDRAVEKPRKDIAKWDEVYQYFDYMFVPYTELQIDFDSITKTYKPELICNIMNRYAEIFNSNFDKEQWFSSVKVIAEEFNFACDNKAYKANPDLFKGNLASLCGIIRYCLTGKNNTPDLFEICKILGKKELQYRVEVLKNKISE